MANISQQVFAEELLCKRHFTRCCRNYRIDINTTLTVTYNLRVEPSLHEHIQKDT